MESKHYVANVADETIVFGDSLANGMRVLIEDSLLRGDESATNSYEVARAEETLNWCKVTKFKIRNGIATFVGVYDDGSLRVRTYATGHGWIVKENSIPNWHEHWNN